MSQWKLVEAEAVGGAHNSAHSKQNHNNPQKGGGKGSQNRQNHSSRRHGSGKDLRNKQSQSRGGNRRQHDIYIPDTPETRQQYASMAVQLLQHYFSNDTLSCDTFMRSYFDCEGYIPIAFVCNFPDVIAIGAYYEDILSQLLASPNFEIDVENETMRVSGWEKWLMPNKEGGFGLPRYIKNPSQQEPPLEEPMRDRSGSKELSATASEFCM